MRVRRRRRERKQAPSDDPSDRAVMIRVEGSGEDNEIAKTNKSAAVTLNGHTEFFVIFTNAAGDILDWFIFFG